MLGLTDKGIKAAIINIFKERGNYALKSKKSSGDSVSSKVKAWGGAVLFVNEAILVSTQTRLLEI